LCFAASGWGGRVCVKKASFQKPGRKNSFGKSAQKLQKEKDWNGLNGLMG
jgi:hypothetical protein